MLTIRLLRTGKKNAPNFRLVLIDKKAPPQSGKFLEILGHYNPRSKELDLKRERINDWLSQGVTLSATVHNLLVKAGVIKGPKIKKQLKTKQKSTDQEALSATESKMTEQTLTEPAPAISEEKIDEKKEKETETDKKKKQEKTDSDSDSN